MAERGSGHYADNRPEGDEEQRVWAWPVTVHEKQETIDINYRTVIAHGARGERECFLSVISRERCLQ